MHSEAGLIAHVLLDGKLGTSEYKQISREMCAQQIGAFGIQLVLKAFFFFSNWQLGPTKPWPVTALHQMIQVEVLCTHVLVTGLISILAL